MNFLTNIYKNIPDTQEKLTGVKNMDLDKNKEN